VGVQLLITADTVILCEVYLNFFQNFFFFCFAMLELLCETFDVRYVVLTVVIVSTVFWDVMPCSQRGKCQYVG